MGLLNIIQIPASDMENFSYLLYCPATKKGAVVDPSMAPEKLLDAARKRQVEIVYLLNTHGHRDHIAGNGLILEQTQAKLAAHPADIPDCDVRLEDGSQLALGAGIISVLHTPGHTPGSLVFRNEKALITGDTLFVGRCGRADLQGSDVTALYESLLKLKALPPEMQIYPGHDYGPTPTSTLAWELENNAYLNCPDLQSFIQLRMG